MQGKLNVWLAFLTRVLGFAGLAYELIGDKLRNPTALVVFGGLAGLPDVLGYRASVKQEIEQDDESREEALGRRERRREREHER